MLVKMGFTKRDRSTVESDIFRFKPDKWFKIRFYIVSEVCFKDHKKRKRGENRFSYEKIGLETGGTKQQIRKCLDWMKKNGMIDTKKETRGMMIKVLKYADYQDVGRQTGDNKEIEGRQTGDTEVDTIEEEGKKERSKNNIEIQKRIESWKVTSDYLNGKYGLRGFPLPEIINKEIIRSFNELKKEGVTLAHFQTGLRNYGTEIVGRVKKEGDTYYDHRFTFLKFLKQSNGLRNFL